jgi:hypothetical protein
MSRAPNRSAALLLTAVVGCARTAAFDLPEAPSRDESALVYLQAPGHSAIIDWVERSANGFDLGFTAPNGASVAIMYLGPSLTDLGIQAGPQPAPDVALTADRAPLAFDAVFESTIDGGHVGTWKNLEPSSDVLVRLGAPILDRPSCTRASGCFAYREGAPASESQACFIPCGTSSVAGPRAPAAPHPLAMDPCPSGWSTEPLADDAGTACRPPARAMVECGADEAQWIDAAVCARVGNDCPVGHWSEVQGNALYVLRSAPANGDGSMGAPFASIAAALPHAPPGTTIALADEPYPEALAIPDRVTLLGACTQKTKLSAPVASGLGSTLANLTVDHAPISVPAEKHLELDSVIIDASGGVAVALGASSTLSASNVLVAGADVAIDGSEGASIVLRNVAIDRSTTHGVRLAGGRATLDAEDLAIRRTNDTSDQIDTPAAVFASGGAHVRLSRTFVDGSYPNCIRAIGPNTAVTADHLALRNGLHTLYSYPLESDIALADFAHLDLSSGIVERGWHYGLSMTSSATADIRDSVFGDILEGGSVAEGVAITANTGLVTASRIVFAGLGWRGIWVNHLARARVSDAFFSDIAALDPRVPSDAVVIEGTASFNGVRIAMRRFKEGAIAVEMSGTSSISEVVIEGMMATQPCIHVDEIAYTWPAFTASIAISRARIDGCALDAVSAGIFDAAPGGGSVPMTRAHVSLSDVALSGSPIELRNVAALFASRISMNGAPGGGIVLSREASCDASDVSISGTQTSGGAVAGAGVAVLDQAMLSLDRFDIVSNAAFGILSESTGAFHLTDGKVQKNPIGIQAPATSFLAPTFDRVDVSMNATNFSE